MGVVTTTSLAPAVPRGELQEISVAVLSTTGASTPLMVTVTLPSRLVPVIVIAVEPAIGPLEGEIDVMVGTKFEYVNPPTLVAVPPAVVTTTDTTLALAAGVTAVMEVADTTVKLVAGTEPNNTLVAPDKFVPVIVIVVAPAVGPVNGLTDVMEGTAK